MNDVAAGTASLEPAQQAASLAPRADAPSKLAAAHLRKRYKARTVVHDVSLDVASGEVVGRHSKRRRRVEFLDFMNPWRSLSGAPVPRRPR